MATELEAAITRYKGGGYNCGSQWNNTMARMKDACTIADAHIAGLAERERLEAADREPVTYNWWHAKYGNKPLAIGEYMLLFVQTDDSVQIIATSKDAHDQFYQRLRGVKTIGDFNRLLAALKFGSDNDTVN